MRTVYTVGHPFVSKQHDNLFRNIIVRHYYVLGLKTVGLEASSIYNDKESFIFGKEIIKFIVHLHIY